MKKEPIVNRETKMEKSKVPVISPLDADDDPSVLYVTLEEAITLTGFGFGNCLTAAVGGLSVLCSQVGLVDLGYALPRIDEEFKMTHAHRGFLTSAFFLGTILSCHLFGFLSDNVGRRYVMLRSLSVNFLLYLSVSLLPGFWTFVVVRFLSGFVVCGTTISGYVYLVETQPVKQRQAVFMVGNMFEPLAFIFVAVVALVVTPETWKLPMYAGYHFSPWRLYYLLCGLPSLLTALMLILTPESPMFLAATGQTQLMQESLRRTHRLNHLLSAATYPTVRLLDQDGLESRTIFRLRNFLKISRLLWTQTASLFRRPFLTNTLKICSFCTMIFISLGFALVYMPTISVHVHSINAGDNHTVCEVAVKITSETDLGEIPLLMYYENLVAAALLMLALLFLILLMRLDFIPLNFTVCGYLSVCLVSILSVQFVKNSFAIIILIESFIVFGSSSFIASLYIFTELYPTRVRGSAVCLMIIFACLGMALANVLVASLLEKHCNALFYTFFFTLLVSVVILAFVPQVKAVVIRDSVLERVTRSVVSH